MIRFELFFVTFLCILTGIEVRADESNEELHQEKNDISNTIPEQENNEKKDINQGNEGAKSTSENLYDEKFFSEEKEEEKVSDEEIAANQAILNESVKENQSGFFGWLGRFIGNILDEINTDRIVDHLWNKSTMKHEGNEEYKAAKGKIDRFLIRKAFRGLFRKYLEGKEINEESTQKFNGEYDKVKMLADIFRGENNNFEEDSLRLIILEKILGDRDDDIRGVLAALDNVSEEKMVELQSLLADLKNNEEEFIKCFADMSAVDKYNLERAAFYDKKGNYCKSQWMMVDKDCIHDTSRGFVTWIKNIWKVVRFVIGIFYFYINISNWKCDENTACCYGKNFFEVLIESKDDILNTLSKFCGKKACAIPGISQMILLYFFSCIPEICGLFGGFKNIFSVLETIIVLLNLFFEYVIENKNEKKWYNDFLIKQGAIINKIVVVFLIASLLLQFLGYIFGLKYVFNVFNKKINKNLAFLLNKKFRYIKNYVETLKKILVLIKGDDVLAGAFKKELLSLEKVFGDEASEETKHMLTEMDKQKLYDSFDDVKDTGEAMLLFDKNKDIFSDCIVDVNKINACVALKMNVPAEELNKKVEEENKNQEACKKEKDLSSEKVKEANPAEKNDVKEHFVTQKQEENKKEEQLDEKVRSDEYKKNKRRANKKRKRKRSAKKRRVRTNKNKRKIENPRNENTPLK